MVGENQEGFYKSPVWPVGRMEKNIDRTPGLLASTSLGPGWPHCKGFHEGVILFLALLARPRGQIAENNRVGRTQARTSVLEADPQDWQEIMDPSVSLRTRCRNDHLGWERRNKILKFEAQAHTLADVP